MTRQKAIEILDRMYDDTLEFRQKFSEANGIDVVNDILIALLTAIDALKENGGDADA